MPEAYIYDHVRTPRGRGKADGALHEVTALALATAPLKALKERNNLGEDVVDDVVLGVVDPVGEAGSDIARFAALQAGLGESVPGVQISRFCASGLDAVNFAAAQIMSGQHELTIGGGAESMSRVGIGASGGAWPMDPFDRGAGLFHAAGRLGRSDRDQIRLLARRRRCLCGAEPAARRQGLGRGPLQEFGGAGQGRQRPDHPGQGRAHAADHDDAVARPVAAVIRGDGPDGRLRRGGDPVASGNRAHQLRAPRRQFVRASSMAPAPCCSAARKPAPSTA